MKAETGAEAGRSTGKKSSAERDTGRRIVTKQYERVTHEFEPVYDSHSEILILGTFPSVKSRENGFYYGHPQNRFWNVLARVFGEAEAPKTIPEKKDLLLRHHIALWDVVLQCEIQGSGDSSIRNVVPADLRRILDYAPIRRIYGNGQKACELYRRYAFPVTGREIIRLPSTSPANAAFQMPQLLEAWKAVAEYSGNC